jgi:signal transduction histidine kinase
MRIPRQPLGRVRLPILFGALIAVIAVTMVLLTHLQNNRTTWVRHTLEVQKAIGDLSNAVYLAETLQRGYLLTESSIFAHNYEVRRQDVPTQMSALKALTADDPQQQAEVRTLQAQLQRKIAEMDNAVALHKAGSMDASLRSLRDGSTRRLSLDVITTLDRMRAREERLLTERTQAAQWLNLALLCTVGVTGVLVIGFCGLWIEQSRKAGRELKSAYEELSAANTDLVSEMASRAAAENQVRQMQKMEAIGQLTGGIAHDFNNMLAVVIGNLNMVQRRLAKGDTDIAAFVESASEGANRAAALTGRLLAFSRRQPLAPDPIEPNRLVKGMSDLLTRTLGEAVVVETILAPDIWRTLADVAQLESALVNLAVNARDAMPSGGRLTIETANVELDEAYAAAEDIRPGQYVMISVTDTGCGMTLEVMDKALEPFFTTKPVGKGTGLGLSQVYGFVKQSAGHLKIHSEPGRGASVTIYLPRLIEADVYQDPPKTVGAPERGPRRKVLVTEDDDRVRLFTEAALKDIGYSVVSAENAAIALTYLKNEPDIDLLLTDVVMPETSGPQLAEQAKKLKPGLPVLYMTGFTPSQMERDGFLEPGVNVMTKPFTVDQLASKVQEALDGAAA